MEGAAVENVKELYGKTLFVFSIGPVQEYIAQARKTQDLYWGSYILSYLTWTAIKNIVEKYGPETIIFPYIKEQPFYEFWRTGLNREKEMESLKIPTIPNRFFAIIPTRDISEIKALNLEQTAKSEFLRMGSYIFDKFLEKDYGIKEKFFKQLESFLEIYWVAFPLENEKKEWREELEKIEDYFLPKEIEEKKELSTAIESCLGKSMELESIYGLLYSFMDRSLGARKAIRDFGQLKEKGRKCSVCGERNVLVYRLLKDEQIRLKDNKKSRKIEILQTQRATIINFEDERIPLKYLAPGEGLCSSCFTKRAADVYFRSLFGSKNVEQSFPSTAEVALYNVVKFEEVILKQKIEQYIRKFENKLGQFNFEFLYQENLTEKNFEKNGLKAVGTDELKESLKDVDKTIEELNLKKRKYYALLKFDGDDMGKWLTGALGPDLLESIDETEVLPADLRKKMMFKKHLITPDFHASISHLLKDFSLIFVKNIFETSGAGKVIYSGGDDVLAIVNLDSLLDVMVRLRAAFTGYLIGEKPDFRIGFDSLDRKIRKLRWDKAGASIGVIIAHYKEALGSVVSSASGLLEYAKSMDGKDAFAIKLLLRSGETYVARAKWYYDDMENQGTIGLLKRVYDYFLEEKVSDNFIKKLEKGLQGLILDSLPPWIFKSELRRVLGRSLSNNLSDREREEIKNDLYEILITLFEDVGYDDMMGLLKIIAFMNRGGLE